MNNNRLSNDDRIQRYWLILCSLLLVFTSCGTTEEDPYIGNIIKGQVTVDENIDQTGDYSGIELKILNHAGDPALPDTIFYTTTDSAGHFQSRSRFLNPAIYTLEIGRRGQTLESVNLVLAPEDTVRLEAELPNVVETLQVYSRENELFETYERLERGLERVLQFARAGHLTGDSLEAELRKWSDLYWDFYQDHPKSFAGEQSAVNALYLLEGWDDEMMIERLEILQQESPSLLPFSSRLAVFYYAHEHGLNRALDYLESLREMELEQQARMEIEQTLIHLLHDSLMLERAGEELARFKEEFSDLERAVEWAEGLEADLTRLAPGMPAPHLEITTLGGEQLHTGSIGEKVLIIEFTRIENFLYQHQYEELINLYREYGNEDVEIITVPFGANPLLMAAFFEEREQLWRFAESGSVDEEQLRADFNIQVIPTRFLIDTNGNIVGKYEGLELEEMFSDFETLINTNLEEVL